MTELFKRAWRLTIGTSVLDGTSPENSVLDIDFTVEKSLKREPNNISLSVKNLSESSRSELENQRNIAIKLEVGYAGNYSSIFDGEIRVARNKRSAKSIRESVTVTTEIEGDDAGRSYRDALISRSFAPGSSVESVLTVAVDAMGIGRGNLRELAGQLSLVGGGTTYPQGTVLSGRASDEIDRIVRSSGLSWSVQDGNFVLQRRGQPVETSAISLTPRTGLIGSPSKDDEGFISATSLLIPDIYPGRKIVLQSRDIEAQTYVDRVKYIGDTVGVSWYCDMELREY